MDQPILTTEPVSCEERCIQNSRIIYCAIVTVILLCLILVLPGWLDLC